MDSGLKKYPKDGSQSLETIEAWWLKGALGTAGPSIHIHRVGKSIKDNCLCASLELKGKKPKPFHPSQIGLGFIVVLEIRARKEMPK